MAVDINPYPILNPESRANPQAIYARMRQSDPVCRLVGPQSGNSFWFFTRYQDVVAILKDPRFVKNVRSLPPHLIEKYTVIEADPAMEAINYHLLNMDPPDHTRLRSLVHKAFTTRMITQLEPRIQSIADELLNHMADHHETDLLEAFAFPLPITVIAEMLGVHHERRDDFRRWTRILLFGSDQDAGKQAVAEFVMYVNELIEERRQQHKGDLLSNLVAVKEDDGDQLSHMELLSMIFLLLIAGHETTVNLIGNGMLALMQHPDQMRLLQDNPTLIKSAVEEMLRYNGPVETTTWRWASEDMTYDGHTISQGDVALPALLAANRDPSVFDNPDVFDIRREPNPHVAFGYGLHYCLGAPLARLEGTIAINALLKRYPKIQLNVEPQHLEWNASLLIHGLKELPVRY